MGGVILQVVSRTSGAVVTCRLPSRNLLKATGTYDGNTGMLSLETIQIRFAEKWAVVGRTGDATVILAEHTFLRMGLDS